MDEARDVIGISIPFTAGVALGLWLTGAVCKGSFSAGVLSAAALASAAILTMTAAARARRGWYAAAYLMTGIFCAATSAAGIVPGPERQGLAMRCAVKLKSVIDSIPFDSQDTAALVKALMTGDKSSLSRETISIFRSSGASHILALSGLHLGIIYMIIARCLSVLGNTVTARRVRCGCVIIAAGFYTLMTGAGPSITRAFLFICIRELSGISAGRRQGAVRTLLICLTVQLAITPRVLVSVGFQLSYLAVCGIVTVLPVLQSWYPEPHSRIGRLDPMRWIWNSAALAISCQMFTAPLAWFRFHTFPRYFLITNIAALPITTLSMALSAVVIPLTAAGICPEILVIADERLISMLTGVLEIICSL